MVRKAVTIDDNGWTWDYSPSSTYTANIGASKTVTTSVTSIVAIWLLTMIMIASHFRL